MLDKPNFDCIKIGEFYDCGCADPDAPEAGKEGDPSTSQSTEQHEEAEGNTSPAFEISKEA